MKICDTDSAGQECLPIVIENNDEPVILVTGESSADAGLRFIKFGDWVANEVPEGTAGAKIFPGLKMVKKKPQNNNVAHSTARPSMI